jgi:predicted hotdog family 3-hydroxylacyl-ACP dehydratase
MKTDLTLPLPAEAFIPHRLPMRLVERLISYEDGAGVVEAIVAEESLLVASDGTLDPVALVELLAQGYAVIKGYDDRLQGKEISEGYLVGVRKLRITGQAHAGAQLMIRIRTIGSFEGFAVAEGEIVTATETIGSGTIKLWVVGDGGTA